MKKVNIIVPVYADWASLKMNIASLSKYYRNKDWVQIYYVNDCGPDVDILEKNIKKNIKRHDNFYYYRNKQNLGFVKNNNNAVNNIISEDGDILFLNSDTKVTKGFLEEMLTVLYSDDAIGIVNPRSNNATVWSVPMDGSLSDSPNLSYRLWNKLKVQIPQSYITPTSHGFCMLVKRGVVDKLGLFDEIYGKGYGEENDFTMRALESGWRCSVANHAFVFHYESKSFGDSLRLELSRRNRKILDKRYPEYTNLIEEYLANTKEVLIKKDSIVWRAVRKIYRGLEYTHDNGYKKSFKALSRYIEKKLNARRLIKVDPSIKVWSNELTNSGAPLVLLSVLEELTKRSLGTGEIKKIELFYPVGCRIEGSFVDRVTALGVDLILDSSLVRNFNKDDIVIINSSGYGVQLYDNILNNMENGVLRHLFFYIHEDGPLWTGMNHHSFVPIRDRITKLLHNDKMTIYTPSEKTQEKWTDFFKTDINFKIMPGKVNLSPRDIIPRGESDFNDIKFILSGTVEPRKMQLSVLGAFDCFYEYFYRKHPERYREWALDIVGAYANEPTNIYNNNVKKYDGKYNRISIHDRMSSDRALDMAKSSNVSIMYSSDESYGMVMIEGMAFGHPIIRSEASGVDEQLRGGLTGWSVSTADLSTLVDAIEEILNKDKTSFEQLVKMSVASNKMAVENMSSSYAIINDIAEIY